MAIDSTDFHLSGFAEYSSTMPKAGTVIFRANGDDYLVTIHFHASTPVINVFEGHPLAWKTIIATAAISECDNHAIYFRIVVFIQNR